MRCEHGNNKIHCSWCLIKERNALRAENEALIKLMEEAMTNCETCRGEAVVSRMCARCQTFYKAIIA